MSSKVKIIRSATQENHEEKVDEFLALENIEVIKITHKVTVTYNTVNYITFVDYREGGNLHEKMATKNNN